MCQCAKIGKNKLGKFEESLQKEGFGLAVPNGEINWGFSERSYWDKLSQILKIRKPKLSPV